MRRVEVSKGGRGWRPARGAAAGPRSEIAIAQIRIDRSRHGHRVRARIARIAALHASLGGNENRIERICFFLVRAMTGAPACPDLRQIKAVCYTVYRLRRIRRSARALPLLGRVAAHGWWAGLWAAEAGPRDKHMVPQRRCAASASDMRRGRQHMRAHPFVSATSFWGVTRLP